MSFLTALHFLLLLLIFIPLSVSLSFPAVLLSCCPLVLLSSCPAVLLSCCPSHNSTFIFLSFKFYFLGYPFPLSSIILTPIIIYPLLFLSYFYHFRHVLFLIRQNVEVDSSPTHRLPHWKARAKAVGAWSWMLTFSQCPYEERPTCAFVA